MRVFLYFILFILAVLAGLALKEDPGYVLIALHHWTIEMPIWFAVVSIFIVVLLYHFGSRLLGSIHHTFSDWKMRCEQRKHLKNIRVLQEGLLHLYAGCWRKAEKLLLQSVQASEMPMVNYLGAAQAAQGLDEGERASRYLAKAKQYSCDNPALLEVVRSHCYFDQGQYELALDGLKKNSTNLKENPCILILLRAIYESQNDWGALKDLLPVFEKYRVLSEADYEEFATEVYCSLLYDQNMLLTEVKQFWKKIPRKFRQRSDVVYVYCLRLLDFDQADEAIQLLSSELNRQWTSELCELYGTVCSSNIKKQLRIAEDWLEYHRDDDQLYLALARMAIVQKDWVKAEDYLLSSLRLQETEQAQALLGVVYERLGRIADALKSYRQVANIVTHVVN